MEKAYLTPKDLMGMLGLGRTTAYALFAEPDFPAHIIGRKLYTTQREFDAWFASKRVNKEVRH